MSAARNACAGTGRPPLTAFAPYRCAVCEAHVYVGARGAVLAHGIPRWHLLRSA